MTGRFWCGELLTERGREASADSIFSTLNYPCCGLIVRIAFSDGCLVHVLYRMILVVRNRLHVVCTLYLHVNQ